MPGDPFYVSPEWRALRIKRLKISGWRCEWCHKSVHKPGAARVDHVQTRREHPELELVLGNTRVLCTNCDARRHVEKGGKVHIGANAQGWPTSKSHHWNK